MKLDDFSSALPFDFHHQKEASYIYFCDVLCLEEKVRIKIARFHIHAPPCISCMYIVYIHTRYVYTYIHTLYTIYMVKNTLIIRHFKTCMGDFYQISQHDIYLLLLKSMSVVVVFF